MQSFRKEKRPLIFVDETLIDSNLTVGKCWQSDEIFCVMKTEDAERRIILLCAGGEMGFIPNAPLAYEVNTTTGDYHRHTNSQVFEKWEQEKLIPNLPKNAVAGIDNAPYRTIRDENGQMTKRRKFFSLPPTLKSCPPPAPHSSKCKNLPLSTYIYKLPSHSSYQETTRLSMFPPPKIPNMKSTSLTPPLPPLDKCSLFPE